MAMTLFFSSFHKSGAVYMSFCLWPMITCHDNWPSREQNTVDLTDTCTYLGDHFPSSSLQVPSVISRASRKTHLTTSASQERRAAPRTQRIQQRVTAAAHRHTRHFTAKVRREKTKHRKQLPTCTVAWFTVFEQQWTAVQFCCSGTAQSVGHSGAVQSYQCRPSMLWGIQEQYKVNVTSNV